MPNLEVCQMLRKRTEAYYNNPKWVSTGSTTPLARLGACFGIAVADLSNRHKVELRSDVISHVWNELSVAYLR